MSTPARTSKAPSKTSCTARALGRSLLFAVACVAGLFGGCANEVDVFTERDNLYFSVQGALDVKDDTHFVRIEPLGDQIPIGTDSVIDATVTMENLSTGATETFRDSVVTVEGVLVHNFWGVMKLQPATTYRLTVERSDGASTVAQATTPTADDEPSINSTVLCTTPIEVTFPGGSGIIGAEIGLFTADRSAWLDKSLTNPRSSQPGSFSFIPECELVPLVGDVDTTMNPFINIPRCTRMQSNDIPIAYLRVGPDWPVIERPLDPASRIDRSLNVERGTGFFGIARRDTVVTTIDKDRSPFINVFSPMKGYCDDYDS